MQRATLEPFPAPALFLCGRVGGTRVSMDEPLGSALEPYPFSKPRLESISNPPHRSHNRLGLKQLMLELWMLQMVFAADYTPKRDLPHYQHPLEQTDFFQAMFVAVWVPEWLCLGLDSPGHSWLWRLKYNLHQGQGR